MAPVRKKLWNSQNESGDLHQTLFELLKNHRKTYRLSSLLNVSLGVITKSESKSCNY